MTLRTLTAGCAAFALFALLGATASASPWNRKTYLTVHQPIEVPGVVLTPGKYVMKLVDSQSSRHIVQFLNGDESRVLSTVIAIPNMRLHPTGKTEFAWYETPAGQPPAMRAWFYPGDEYGQEFAYPEGRAKTLAQQSQHNVMQTPKASPASANSVAAMREKEIVAVTPSQKTRKDYQAALGENEKIDRAKPYRPATEPVTTEHAEIAQAQAPQMAQTQSAPAPTQMPQTAGLGALFVLIGFGSLGASTAIRKLRKS